MSLGRRNTHVRQSEAVCFGRFGRVVDRHVFSERICSNRLQRRRRLLARAGRLRLSAERPSRHPSRRLELERRRAPCLERARGSRLLARRSVAGFLKRACGREALFPAALTYAHNGASAHRPTRKQLLISKGADRHNWRLTSDSARPLRLLRTGRNSAPFSSSPCPAASR